MEIQKNKIGRKIKTKKMSATDRYFSIVLKAIGLLFLAFSGRYFFQSQDSGLIEKLIGYFTALDNTVPISNGSGSFPREIFINLLMCFIPQILSIIGVLYFSKKHPHKAYSALLTIIVLMTFFNAIMFFYWKFYLGIFCYYNYSIASIFLTIPFILFFISYWIYKKQGLLIAILLYFYFFMFEMLIEWVIYRYYYVLTTILIFSISLFIISRRNKNYLQTILNCLFAYGFLLIFVLKKFIFNANITYLSLFLTISFLYFICFYSITLYYSIKENKNIFSVFNLLNTLLYIVLNGYILSKFGYSDYIIIVVFVTLIVHLLTIIVYNKYYYIKTRLTTLEIISLVLISTSVSLLLRDYFYSIFLGVISILILLYAKKYKSRIFVIFCLVTTFLLVVNFIYLTINTYFTLLNFTANEAANILQNVFINSCIALFFVFLIKKVLVNTKKEGLRNWFNRWKYTRYLDILLTITSFVFVELLCFSLLYSTAYELAFSNRIILFIGGVFSLFIIKKDTFFTKKIKNWIYFSIYFFAIFFLSQIYINFSFTSIKYIFSNNFTIFEVVLHYIELFLALTILYISFARLYSMYISKRKDFLQFIIFTLYFFCTIVICKEYDYLSILSSDLSSRISEDDFNMILNLNEIFPYSIIILICTSLLLIIGINLKSLFLRGISILIIVADLIKIFFIEFNEVTDNNKGVFFIVTGAIFLFLSWFYNKTRHKSSNRVSRKIN